LVAGRFPGDFYDMLITISNTKMLKEHKSMPRRVLMIEDDKDIAHLVELHLRDTGYEVNLAFDGNAGIEQALSKNHDLIILDLMLPGMDGLEICRRLRTAATYVPILMLTSRSSEIDRVLGLEIGADDYLTKPFGIRELMARVKALFRRVEALKSEAAHQSHETIQTGDIVVDVEKRKVTLRGNPVMLTAKEFDLLLHFMNCPGRVNTRKELLNLVWGYGYEGYEHTVNSHINRLRAKIEENPAQPRYILSVRGIGYKLSDSADMDKG
jgi:two-component system, OmpR family, alkaline phosphatase synthesis response regulator PhoP